MVRATPPQRDETIKNFRSGEIWFLICTDLMARGIDFRGVSCVINYDFPQSTQEYIHRIGALQSFGTSVPSSLTEAISLCRTHRSCG